MTPEDESRCRCRYEVVRASQPDMPVITNGSPQNNQGTDWVAKAIGKDSKGQGFAYEPSLHFGNPRAVWRAAIKNIALEKDKMVAEKWVQNQPASSRERLRELLGLSGDGSPVQLQQGSLSSTSGSATRKSEVALKSSPPPVKRSRAMLEKDDAEHLPAETTASATSPTRESKRRHPSKPASPAEGSRKSIKAPAIPKPGLSPKTVVPPRSSGAQEVEVVEESLVSPSVTPPGASLTVHVTGPLVKPIPADIPLQAESVPLDGPQPIPKPPSSPATEDGRPGRSAWSDPIIESSKPVSARNSFLPRSSISPADTKLLIEWLDGFGLPASSVGRLRDVLESHGFSSVHYLHCLKSLSSPRRDSVLRRIQSGPRDGGDPLSTIEFAMFEEGLSKL